MILDDRIDKYLRVFDGSEVKYIFILNESKTMDEGITSKAACDRPPTFRTEPTLPPARSERTQEQQGGQHHRLFKDDFTQILDCIMQVPPLQLNQVAQIRGVIKDGPCKVTIVPPRALLDPL